MRFIVNSKYLEKNITAAIEINADAFFGKMGDLRFINPDSVVSLTVEPTKNERDSVVVGGFNKEVWDKVRLYLQMLPEQPIVVEMDGFDLEISQHIACFKINF